MANNPAIMALHEAQRLWPGRPMELVLSVGTGKDEVTRRERGGWGLVETFGEFMIESATSSDRVQEALEVFAPLVPHTSFFRLQVEDARCNIEIDDTSAASAASITRATDEYIAANAALYREIAALLEAQAAGEAETETGPRRSGAQEFGACGKGGGVGHDGGGEAGEGEGGMGAERDSQTDWGDGFDAYDGCKLQRALPTSPIAASPGALRGGGAPTGAGALHAGLEPRGRNGRAKRGLGSEMTVLVLESSLLSGHGTGGSAPNPNSPVGARQGGATDPSSARPPPSPPLSSPLTLAGPPPLSSPFTLAGPVATAVDVFRQHSIAHDFHSFCTASTDPPALEWRDELRYAKKSPMSTITSHVRSPKRDLLVRVLPSGRPQTLVVF